MLIHFFIPTGTDTVDRCSVFADKREKPKKVHIAVRRVATVFVFCDESINAKHTTS